MFVLIHKATPSHFVMTGLAFDTMEKVIAFLDQAKLPVPEYSILDITVASIIRLAA